MTDFNIDFNITPAFYTRFVSACKSGNIEKIKKYISGGGDVTTDNNSGIRWASLYGRLDAVKCLVEYGADVRAMDDCSIAWAARGGHLSVVKFLIENGANPHVYSDEAVRWASTHGKFEIAKYLIVECGCDISRVSDMCRAYISFCQRMDEKTKVRAQKKIYFWWIEICYDMEHPSGCGKRMALKNFREFERITRLSFGGLRPES
jgi:hypothetical protein